jgi:hypothetical protein
LSPICLRWKNGNSLKGKAISAGASNAEHVLSVIPKSGYLQFDLQKIAFARQISR